MKLNNITTLNMDPIRKLLLYTDAPQIISVGQEDVENLFTGASSLSLFVSHGENLSEALNKIDPAHLDNDKATKAILVVRTSRPNQIHTAELTEISNLIDQYLPQAEICWGLASKRDDLHNVTVIAATTH